MSIIVVFGAIMFAFMCIQAITGSFLLYHAIKNKILNIAIMGIGFILAFISTFIVTIFQVRWTDVAFLLMLAFFTAIPFTQMTFNQNKNNKFSIIITLGIILYVGKITYAYLEKASPIHINSVISLTFETVFLLLCFGWLGFSALRAYKKIKDTPAEPWIKKRFIIISVSSFTMSFNGFPQYLMIIYDFTLEEIIPLSILVWIILLIISAIFSIGMLLAWLMPEWFRKLLDGKNRLDSDESQNKDDLLSDEEIMNKLGEGSS